MSLTSEFFDRINSGVDSIKERRGRQLDDAIKMAQLQEAGYQLTPRGIVRDPSILSTKQLENQIKQIDYISKVKDLETKKLVEDEWNKQKNTQQLNQVGQSGFGVGQQPRYIYEPNISTGKFERVVNPNSTTAYQQSLGKRFDSMRSDRIRNEFNQLKPVKDYDIILGASKKIEQAYASSMSQDEKSRIASDQALGVLFQKLLDPDSVVRESEYARTPEGASFMNRMQSIIPQLMRGGLRISDKDRAAIYKMSKKLLDSAGDLYNQRYGGYESMAQREGLDPELIFAGKKRYESMKFYDTPEEADANEAPGTIVMIMGRGRYQV